MESNKPNPKSKATKMSVDNDFYETMPLSLGSDYVYRGEMMERYSGADGRTDENYEANVRRVAIVTLIVVAVVAVGFGLLFIQSMSLLKDAMPINQTSSGSLEL